MSKYLLFLLFAVPLVAIAQPTPDSVEAQQFLPLEATEKLGYTIVLNAQNADMNTLTLTAEDSRDHSTRQVGTFNDIFFIHWRTNTIQGLEFSDDRTMCVIRSYVGNNKGSVYSLTLVDGKAGTIQKIAEGHIFFSRLSPDGRYLVFAPDSATSGNPLEFTIVSTQSASVVCNLVWPDDFDSIFTRVSFRRLAGSNDLLVLKDEEDRVIEVSILDLTDFSLHDVTASYIKPGKYLNMFDPAWQDSVMTERIGTIIFR